MVRALVLLCCALLLGACSTAASGDAGNGFVSGDGTIEVIPPERREPAPEVVAETIDGDVLALADIDGPVVVNFWASWCGPCAREAPALAAFADRYEGEVAVVGVDVKDSPASARSFHEQYRLPYPSWSDPPGAIAASFGGIGPAGLPSTIVLDAEHRVAVRMLGQITAAQLDQAVGDVLGGDGGG